MDCSLTFLFRMNSMYVSLQVNVDYSSLKSMFELLHRKTAHTTAYSHLLSITYHCLLLPSKFVHVYWKSWSTNYRTASFSESLATPFLSYSWWSSLCQVLAPHWSLSAASCPTAETGSGPRCICGTYQCGQPCAAVCLPPPSILNLTISPFVCQFLSLTFTRSLPQNKIQTLLIGMLIIYIHSDWLRKMN